MNSIKIIPHFINFLNDLLADLIFCGDTLHMRTILASSFLGLLIPTTVLADDQVATAPFNDGTTRVCLVVVRTESPLSWWDANERATFANSMLIAPTSAAMSTALKNLANTLGTWDCVGPWLGVLRNGSTDPIGDGWTDPVNAPVSYTDWSTGEPAGAEALRWGAVFDGRSGSLEGWVNVLPDPDAGPDVYGYAFSIPQGLPDCDEDGIPDLLEIMLFNAPDADEDGVPDTCTGVPADLDNDGNVNGSDLGLFLALWGTCPTGLPCPADFNGDGFVNGSDLGIFLAEWSG